MKESEQMLVTLEELMGDDLLKYGHITANNMLVYNFLEKNISGFPPIQETIDNVWKKVRKNNQGSSTTMANVNVDIFRIISSNSMGSFEIIDGDKITNVKETYEKILRLNDIMADIDAVLEDPLIHISFSSETILKNTQKYFENSGYVFGDRQFVLQNSKNELEVAMFPFKKWLPMILVNKILISQELVLPVLVLKGKDYRWLECTVKFIINSANVLYLFDCEK